MMVRGGYPEIRGLDGRDRADRYAGYLDSIVEESIKFRGVLGVGPCWCRQVGWTSSAI
jgi:hypothetical protein